MLNANPQPPVPELPAFPTVFKIRGRGYVRRSDLNYYKAALMAQALGVAPVVPSPVEPDPLIPLPAVGPELGIGRRTIGRRIKAAEGA
jgi:hypothetical protein